MTVQWSAAALTVLAAAGAGIYIAAVFDGIRGGGGVLLPGLIASAALLAAALVITTLNVGNPARIANIFGHISSGFSMAMTASLLLLVLALYGLRPQAGNVSSAIGVVIAVIICFGIALMYMKPSRPAIYGWAVPLYAVSFTAAAGAFFYGIFCGERCKGLTAVKAAVVLMQIIAVGGFLAGVYSSGTADRYLNLSMLLKGELSAVFYAAVVAAGLAVPALSVAADMVSGRRALWSVIGFIGVFAGGAGFSAVLNISASIRKLI